MKCGFTLNRWHKIEIIPTKRLENSNKENTPPTYTYIRVQMDNFRKIKFPKDIIIEYAQSSRSWTRRDPFYIRGWWTKWFIRLFIGRLSAVNRGYRRLMRRVIAKGATRLECTSLSRVSALLINLWIPRITGPDSDPLNTESLLFDHVITLWNFYLVTRCALFFFNAFESGL